MKRAIAFGTTGAILGAILAAGSAYAQNATPSAAERADSDSYLRYLLVDGVFSSGEIDVIRNSLGVDRTCALIRPAFDAAIRELSPKWHEIFVELEAGAGSPGALGKSNNGEATMLQRQFLLGLGLKHGELLEQRASKVRDTALIQAFNVPDDTIDYEARQREIKAARSDGRLLCGLTEGPKEP